MKKFNYQNEDNHFFITYETEARLDHVSLAMILKNEIAEFLPVFYEDGGMTNAFAYEITGKYNIRYLLREAVGKEEVLKILKSLANALTECEEYLIPLSCMVIQPEYIYWDKDTDKIRMVCLPLLEEAEENMGSRLYRLFEIFEIKEGTKARYYKSICTYLEENQDIKPREFLAFLEELEELQEEEPAEKIQEEEPVNEEPINEEPVNEEPVNEEPVNEEPEEEAFVSDDDAPTVFLARDVQLVRGKLLCHRTNQVFYLAGERAIIGKGTDQVDFKVQGNENLSRRHASLIQKNGEFYIKDEGSKNHTYVNNRLIPMHQEVLLQDEDRLELANEKFTFYLEFM